jgi:hypothetical protein
MASFMRRQAAKKSARAQGRGVAREIAIPLPLNGLFNEAKTAEFSGLYAAELINIKSNGVALEVIPSFTYGPLDETALRRIPFEFGAFEQYIAIRSTIVNSGSASLMRSVDPGASHGYISSQAVIADGKGPPITFDGTSFQERVFTTSTGVDPETFDGVLIHHDRPYFWRENGDLEFYYGDVGAVQGPLSRFPLGRLGNITGKMVAMASLTIDAANNLNDSLCVVTSSGNIVVYEGLDPGDPQDWRLSARVKSAPPISKFGFVKVGGDIWMLTASGLVSIVDSIRRGVLALVGNVSRPVASGIRDLIATGQGEWQLHISADGAQVILNRYHDGDAVQFIYHPENQVWETATYPAKYWHNKGLKTQFTTSTGVMATLGEPSDNSQVVTAVWESGWFNLRRSSEIKWVRPTIIAKKPLEVRLVVLSDHDSTQTDIDEAEQTLTVNPDISGSDGENVALNEEFGVDAVGRSFQFRLEVTATWAQIVSMEAGVL